jgi:putative membrane protein
MSDQNRLTPPVPTNKFLDYAQWAFALAGAAVALLFPLNGGGSAGSVALMLTIPFAVIHGVRRYGWKLFLGFFIVTFVVSNGFENLSIMTGFPFGNYYYTGSPKLFYVPLVVGPLYFGLGYVSWLVASTILDRADERLNLRERSGRINVVILPILAAAAMTAFDVGSDSVASTVSLTWIWGHGGGLFGVPYTNYLGWWFVTYVFFQIFSLMIALRSPARTINASAMLTPIIIYLSLGLSSVTYFIATAGSADVVKDQAGTSWSLAQLAETMMTINIFGLVVFAFIALAKLAKGDVNTSR